MRVPGIAKKTMMAIKVRYGNVVCALCSIESGTFKGSGAISDSFGIVAVCGSFSVNGDTLTFSGVSGLQFKANALGSSMVFTAGDKATIEAVIAW